MKHANMRETLPGLWEPAIPIEATGWTGFVVRRRCRKSGGHFWHVETPMAGIACCRCGARDNRRPRTKLCDGPYTEQETTNG